MNILIRLDDDSGKLFKKYATLNNISISELVRTSVFEKIEDEYDLSVYNTAMKAFKEDSKTYSLEEVEKELCL
jgi:hypothetical protein